MALHRLIVDRLAALLGPSAAGGGEDVLVLRRVALAGVTHGAIVAVTKYLAATAEEIAAAVGIPRRTLARKRGPGRLDLRTSEKIVRLARVAARAEEVLGGSEDMRRWLRTPNAALGHELPLAMLDTDLGAEAVLTTLGRLEHGIFA